MTKTQGKPSDANFSVSSCVRNDVWHPGKGPEGYEWWYFDALSDNGREAIVVIFMDNFIFSPRYNALNRKKSRNGKVNAGDAPLFPAVAFTYYRDGKPVFRSITEHPAESFSADPEWPYCAIGESYFRYEKAPYGSGYFVSVSAPLRGGSKLKAQFEWLSIESDLAPEAEDEGQSGHSWNLVAPRSDVTGKIIVEPDMKKAAEEVHFRGTGYHDHNLDRRWLPSAVSKWNWGRFHFADATAVYYDYHGSHPEDRFAKLVLITEDGVAVEDAAMEVIAERRDICGLRYPSRLQIIAESGSQLEILRSQVVDSSFFYTRFISDAALEQPDGSPRLARGIGEFLAPGRLRRRWLDPLIDMRIGKPGRRPLLP